MAELLGCVEVPQPCNPTGQLSRAPVRPSAHSAAGLPWGGEAEVHQTRHCLGSPQPGKETGTVDDDATATGPVLGLFVQEHARPPDQMKEPRDCPRLAAEGPAA